MEELEILLSRSPWPVTFGRNSQPNLIFSYQVLGHESAGVVSKVWWMIGDGSICRVAAGIFLSPPVYS
jgi:hypothetical protein